MRTRRAARRAALVLCGAGALALLPAGTAHAHPLGNFTVNHYSGIVISPTGVQVDHVVDFAEVPATQERPRVDRDGDGALSGSELQGYADDSCRRTAQAVRIELDGAPLATVAGPARAASLPGQAGLQTLRVECRLTATLSGLREPSTLTFVDTAADDQIGWREITALGDRATILDSDAPKESVSRRLSAYPGDLLSSPLDQTSARLTVRAGGPALADAQAPELPLAAFPQVTDRLTTAFESLVGRQQLTLLFALLSLLAAAGLGAAHAVAPGHGKTVMAFYLAGQQERAVRTAAAIGATVTVTHTAGVLLLGLLVATTTAVAPAALYPWLTAASGLLIAGVGVLLLSRSAPALRRVLGGAPAQAGHGHSHGHAHGHSHGHSHADGHSHEPAHEHSHGHSHADGHSHEPAHEHGSSPGPGLSPADSPARVSVLDRAHDHEQVAAPGRAEPPGRGGLLAIGVAGGLLPSPSALLVLLGSVALGRAWFGVLLVVAFGLGMAATLTVAGLLVLRARQGLERLARRRDSRRSAGHWFVRWSAFLPVATAAVVLTLGLLITTRGLAAAS